VAGVDEIRAGLAKAARERAEADERHARATADLRRWLREARDAEGFTMSEAARLGGVSRKSAYALLDGGS
jgi:hypothetical protein